MPARFAACTAGKCSPAFAGGTADAFTLFERFEGKLGEIRQFDPGRHRLAKDWRTDRSLRRLEALLWRRGRGKHVLISGNGDVIEPEHDLIAIGSGRRFRAGRGAGIHASGAVRPPTSSSVSLTIAADICIYTNRNLTIEEL